MSAKEVRVARSAARGTILAGGIALVGGALAFLGVFSYLAARCNLRWIEPSSHDALALRGRQSCQTGAARLLKSPNDEAFDGPLS